MNEYVYLTKKQIAEDPRFPFTYSSIRHLIFKAKQNGLEHAIRKIGNKIWIREDLLVQWIEDHRRSQKEKEPKD
jgi:hypothetical protein